MNAVVVTFDRLPLHFLGCYGNQWTETPNFDRLAAESVVFDHHFGENFDPGAANHAWWTGCYQFIRSANEQTKLPDAIAGWQSAGIETWLFAESTDANAAPGQPDWARFQQVPADPTAAHDSAQRPFTRLVQVASETFDELGSDQSPGWLVWLKSQGVPQEWPLPPDRLNRSREAFLAETAAIDNVDVDPADVDRAARSAAGVTLLDQALARLLDRLDGIGPHLLIVTAAEGMRLNERRDAPDLGGRIDEAIVHTPLFVRIRPSDDIGQRSLHLVQTVDVVPTLSEWFQIDAPTSEGQSLLPIVRGEPYEPRQFLCLGEARRAVGLRTAEFYLTSAQTDGPSQQRLFVKPDDVWERHDVAEQSPEDVEALASLRDQFLSKPPSRPQ